MLTRDDQTIEDCLEVYDVRARRAARPYRLQGRRGRSRHAQAPARPHQGGRPHQLHGSGQHQPRQLPALGRGRRQARHRLPAGRHRRWPICWACCAGTATGYFPFPGIPVGHPTKLGGTAQRIADDYARDGDGRAAPASTCSPTARPTPTRSTSCAPRARPPTRPSSSPAASIRRPASATSPAPAPTLFTIGTAALDGSFSPRYGLLANQLRRILAACASSDLRSPRHLSRRGAPPFMFLGIDIGTPEPEGGGAGRRAAAGGPRRRSYPHAFPQPGWAEQEPAPLGSGARRRRSRRRWRRRVAGRATSRRSASPASSTAASPVDADGRALGTLPHLDGPARRCRARRRCARGCGRRSPPHRRRARRQPHGAEDALAKRDHAAQAGAAPVPSARHLSGRAADRRAR